MSFKALQLRLIEFLNLRLQNGDFTERGLARILGLSQSHVHNVLKGMRALTPDTADRVLRRFDMSVLDLLEQREVSEQASTRRSPKSAVSLRPNELPGAHVPVMRLDKTPKNKAS